jgi:hypothetical protein
MGLDAGSANVCVLGMKEDSKSVEEHDTVTEAPALSTAESRETNSTSQKLLFSSDAGAWRELAAGWVGAALTRPHWIEHAVGTECEAQMRGAHAHLELAWHSIFITVQLQIEEQKQQVNMTDELGFLFNGHGQCAAPHATIIALS